MQYLCSGLFLEFGPGSRFVKYRREVWFEASCSRLLIDRLWALGIEPSTFQLGVTHPDHDSIPNLFRMLVIKCGVCIFNVLHCLGSSPLLERLHFICARITPVRVTAPIASWELTRGPGSARAVTTVTIPAVGSSPPPLQEEEHLL